MKSLFTISKKNSATSDCKAYGPAYGAKLLLVAAGFLMIPLLMGCGSVAKAVHDRATTEIANDLLGEQVWTGENSIWTFAGPEEFESMRIVSVNGGENETRFIVDMDLIDMYTYETYSMRANVEYSHWGNSDDWTLASVNCIRWTRRY